jgi:hypothetical protein
MDKSDILKEISFGERTAESESDNLGDYFVETDEWRQLYDGEANIVYGPKGSGKSALYALLTNRKNDLFDRRIITTPAENVGGTPVFRDLASDPPTSENEFRNLWKLYFLSLIGNSLREYGVNNDPAKELNKTLEEADLLPKEWDLGLVLRTVKDYLNNYINPDAVEGGLDIDPVTGTPSGVKGKIVFSQPNKRQYKSGIRSADKLISLANEALEEVGYELWILLDRLDVAFARSKELEGNALRSLFRVYMDMKGADSITPKIFLRDDIWNRISREGFREASHITKDITIKWNKNTLINVVVKRLLNNRVMCDYLDVNREKVSDDISKQEDVFYRVFPDQIDVGERKPSAFDWMLYRTVDATDSYVPRELIHLLTSAREIQIRRLETGFEEPDGEKLFERKTFKDALPEVSKSRLENTLYAEYPDLRPWIEQLEGEKSEQYPETLSEIWEVSRDEALDKAHRLVEVGFFEKKGSKKDGFSFWTPFLYRPALDLTQGSASFPS